jgi:hypothetical protein
MKKQMIRLLNAGEIECRAATVNEKGISLLLYKDARVDQRILDETFGPFGWKRSHQCIDGNLYCTVEIHDPESGEWIAKQDVGTAGFTEKEKSQASDSFKRACSNWGIGRELYSAPFIWIPADRCSIRKKTDRDGREHFYTNDRFSVAHISYNKEREISHLAIVNGNGQTVFERTITVPQTVASADAKKEATHITTQQMDSLQSELQRTGVGMEAVQERYHIDTPSQMTEDLYNRVMNALANTKSAVA